MKKIYFKSLLVSTLFTILVFVLIPRLLFINSIDFYPFSLGVFKYLGILFVLTGIFLAIKSINIFAKKGEGTPAPIDPPKKFVGRGVYKLNRNPMYTGAFLILLGEALLFESAILIIYFLVFIILVNYYVLAFEEPQLKKRFGKSYRDYLERVPRWF
jgi:protein-S-isoprenylcysteine O-methyltransferase Ste14